MKAIYRPLDLEVGPPIVLQGDSAHHLFVTRCNVGDELLLLNGRGKRLRGTIIALKKNEIIIQGKELYVGERPHSFALAIGTPKKDVFEDILKIATELGVTDIYPLASQYSQYHYLKNERFDRVIESALIQSNNLYWPIIHETMTLDLFLKKNEQDLYLFTCKNEFSKCVLHQSSSGIIMIGPEGGFSLDEENSIMAHKNARTIHLKTPILRAKTAVAAALGHVLFY